MKGLPGVALLAASIISAPEGAFGQSIADVARQERARREQARPAVVLTNETIARIPSTLTTAEAPASPGEDAAAVKAPAAEAPGEAGPVRNEQWWRTEFAAARAELKRSEDQVAVLQLELNRLNRDFLQRSDIYNREARLGAEIAAVNASMDAERQAADNARKKIAQLEDDLRRSGGLPAWAR